MAPSKWTPKDERQYEHVRQSERERGRGDARAKEIAARTVNKQRRQQGRTPSRRTQGTGNPERALETHTRDELYNQARALGIEGRSAMRKAELVEAIREAT